MTAGPKHLVTLLLLAGAVACGCSGDEDPTTPIPDPVSAVAATFAGAIDLDDLPAYAGQPVPRYIRKDNSLAAPITDAGATLGRVLFYDRLLSVDGTISCSSCHRQELAFSDDARASEGMSGVTARHSMRLVNVQFAQEARMFWNERAESLEDQTTQPIRDHIEMGFSGQDGNPGLDSLLARLEATDYYRELFTFVHGDATVTEERLQDALSQFLRSIRSFDSKYDEGRALAPDDRTPFPNFTDQENLGKQLFVVPPTLSAQGERIGGGLACAGCHRAPEFDIDPEMKNNGVIRTISGEGTDLSVTRAPTLRDVVKADGSPNGPLMHTGDFDLDDVLDHYDRIPAEGNTNLDNRLQPQGNPQRLYLTPEEREAVKAFLRTLAGSAIYTDPKWSDPFPDR
ncbi:cytochrome-c peroxidase [bacterium]|nr:cytochrome-c peroxidase [bacterium]